MSNIYHLLDESEAFSERNGGAISRWVANVLRAGDEIVLCPAFDASWQFPAKRIYRLPYWGLTHPIHPVLYRLPWIVQKPLYMGVFQNLFSMLQPGDILYTHNRPESASVLAAAAQKRGFRLVLHMHNSHLTRASKGQLAALKNATIVFCSEFLRKEADAACPRHFNSTYVVRNGADDKKFYEAARNSAAGSTIIFSGRLVPYKGVHILTDAMRILQTKGITAQCKIVGTSGFGSSKASQYARSLKSNAPSNTELLGYVNGNELAELLRKADIFCCPSLWKDPFPLAPLEAMATGLPIVASDTGGLPEMLAYGGGILVPPGNADALATALEQLLSNNCLRRRLGEEAAAAFREHFLWSSVRAQYELVLAGVRG